MFVNRTVRPLGCACGMTMLYRIDVHVIHVLVQVIIVPDYVFPETALPDAAFALANARCTHAFAPLDATDEPGFDQHPPHRAIAIACRQCPDRMQVIRQDHPRKDIERMPFLDDAYGPSQICNPIDQQRAGTFGKIHREEIGSACQVGASVFHGMIVALDVGLRKLSPTYSDPFFCPARPFPLSRVTRAIHGARPSGQLRCSRALLRPQSPPSPTWGEGKIHISPR